MCDINPDKFKKYRTRLTVGGNLLDYAGVLSTPTATVTTTKYLLNSIISTLDDRCIAAGIKHFYLSNNLPDPEYMKLYMSIIPKEIIAAYIMITLHDNNSWVYMKIYKGMYGFKQAGIISNLELQNHIENFGYRPVCITAGLWKHDTNYTILTLLVVNFFIKYTSKVNEEHFLRASRKNTQSQLK